KLENKNVELEFQVLNYARENAYLKATYKNLFDSIYVSRTQTKTITASLQKQLHNSIYENAKLRAQLFNKVSDQKDNKSGTSVNTKFAKQSIVENLPKVGEKHALSKPVTSNSDPTLQDSKVMKNDKMLKRDDEGLERLGMVLGILGTYNAQDSRTRISQRVTMDSQRVDLLMEDRIAHQETILIMEEETYVAREAWAHSIGLSQAVYSELQTHSEQASGTDDRDSLSDGRHEMRDRQIMAPMTRQGPNIPPNNTNPNDMPPESVQAMINQALQRNSTIGDGSHRTEGVVGLTRWIKKMESVFQISGYAIKNQVKFATCTLLDDALTWWNRQIRSLGPDVYSMTWEVLKKKIIDKYCPYGEIKKLEIKLWNLKVKGNDVSTYTERFQELTLICTKFVANEIEKIDKYISGLPDNIYESVKSSKPKTLDETIELANNFMDQKLRTYAERQTNNKQKADDSSRNNHGHQQQPAKRQNVTKDTLKASLSSSSLNLNEQHYPTALTCTSSIVDSVATALETQAATMANADNRNPEPREALVARKCSYKEFMSCQPFNFKGEIVTGTLTEEALSWWNSFAQPIGIEEAYKITWIEFKKLLIKKFQELATLCPTMVSDSEKPLEAFIEGLPRSIEGNVTASKPQTLEEAINIAQRLMD
nr:reverse transcriptase domain-containing protein [Tanacetum cinerariifolium]